MACRKLNTFMLATLIYIIPSTVKFYNCFNMRMLVNSMLRPSFRLPFFCFSDVKNELKKMPVHSFITNKTTQTILSSLGIVDLFPIQYQTYEWLLNGKDLLASDRTGSGKTFAYALPVLERLRQENKFVNKQVKFLVMCPTRQLVLQVTTEFNKMSQGHRDFNTVAIYGGAPISDQFKLLQRNADVIVATPGRLIDFLERGAINLTHLCAVCLDEADTMLEKGFKEDIQKIYRIIRNEGKGSSLQNIMFSATIPPFVDSISSQYFAPDKKVIKLVEDGANKTPHTVTHKALYLENVFNVQIISQIIEEESKGGRVLIFVQKKVEADILANKLRAIALHGDNPQHLRIRNLNLFKSGEVKVLVATDVASRGLDIPNVELILQINPPSNTQQYIHRAGRAGRAGKTGTSVVLVDKKRAPELFEIEKEAQLKFQVNGTSLQAYLKTHGIYQTDGRSSGSKSYFGRNQRYESSFGTQRKTYGGQRTFSSFGGDRDSIGGDRDSFGGDRESSFGRGRDSSFGRERDYSFGDKKQYQENKYSDREPSGQRNFESKDYGKSLLQTNQNYFKIFIGKMPIDMAKEDLQRFFQQRQIKYELISIKTFRQTSEKPKKTIAFVQLRSKEDCLKAIGPHQFYGDKIIIRMQNPR